MKALTVRQPWASLIMNRTKWIETRAQRIRIRGRIGIVAGLHRPADGTKVGNWTYYRAIANPEWGDWLHNGHPKVTDAPRGFLIGTVELYDCVPIDQFNGHPALAFYEPQSGAYVPQRITEQLPYGDFTPGRWAWLLRDPQPLAEHRPMPGFQGWREVDL